MAGRHIAGHAERGFVLATTLMVTTLLTVMLAASLLLASAEQRTTDNSFGAFRALVLAEAGLQAYLNAPHDLDTSSAYDSARIALSGGYADVVASRVRPAGATVGSRLALWVVRSTGVATQAVMAGQVRGTRTIAQLAQFNPGRLPARAAMMALNGVDVIGPPGATFPVSGHDLNPLLCAGDPTGAAADTFAINVPRGLYSVTGGNTVPPIYQYGIRMVDTMPFPTGVNLYDTTHVDWAGVLAGNFIPDYIYPPGPWPPDGVYDFSVGYVAGDVTLPVGQKRGMLIVTGNVTAVAGTHWDGIILAGGRFTTQPSNLTNFAIHGMIVTGLNVALGQNVGKNQVQHGMVTIQWAWCYAQSSVSALSKLVPIQNTWADTWSTY